MFHAPLGARNNYMNQTRYKAPVDEHRISEAVP